MTVKGAVPPVRKSFQEAAEKPQDFLQLFKLMTLLLANLETNDPEAPASEDNGFVAALINALFPTHNKPPGSLSSTVEHSLDEVANFGRSTYRSAGEKLSRARDMAENFSDSIVSTGAFGAIRKHLLNTIARPESGGNYNISNGGHTYALTSMTIDQVIALQKSIVRKGDDSSAMGRYQVMGFKLVEMKNRGIVSGNDFFDVTTQDKIGLQLLKDRGLDKFLAGDMTANNFATNITKEWAGWKNASGRGHYDRDGINHATGEFNELVTAAHKARDGVRLAARTEEPGPTGMT